MFSISEMRSLEEDIPLQVHKFIYLILATKLVSSSFINPENINTCLFAVSDINFVATYICFPNMV